MKQSRAVSMFLELCQILSPSGDECRTAEYCRKKLTAMGFDVHEDSAGKAIGGNQGNIIAVLNGNTTQLPPVMLNAHMDTVDPGGKIEPIIVGNRIVSKGNTILGADNRAGIVMILEGVREFIESGKNRGRIEIVLTIGEEAGLIGAQHLDYSYLLSKYGFALDSSGLGRIAQGAPFYNAIDVTVNGRSAHAAVNADVGINSISLVADAVSSLTFGKLDHETTSNIGEISGGTARNVVPSCCKAVLEVRSHNEERLNTETDKISDAFRTLEQQVTIETGDQTFTPKVEVNVMRECDGFYLGDDSPVIECACQALREIRKSPVLYRNMGGSDANVFNTRGLEVAVVGTGQMAVHSTEEYIEIKDLEDGIELVQCLIEQWGHWWSQKKT